MENKRLSTVISEKLRLYRALKVREENKRELKLHGIEKNIFPVLISKEAARKKEILFNQINKAIDSLNPTERMIIEKRFLNSSNIKDSSIYLQTGLKKGKYYEHKRRAIETIAKELGMI